MGIVFVLLLILAGWLIYRYWSQNGLDIVRSDGKGLHQTPEDILKRRLAEGKIDEKEYTRIRRTIGS